MARIFPFQPYRYTLKAGSLSDVVTQPYDKITPAMQARYQAQSPYNLVRIILGERKPSDSENDNVYTRAAAHLKDWIARGVLEHESEPSLYAYFQEFTVPDTNEKLVRQGFIGLGAIEPYAEKIVHRHEQTLTGPKKDRMELLRHTHAHFGQIFMLYPDPAGEIDRILAEAAETAPEGVTVDEYFAVHRFWRISDPARIERIQSLMTDKKLLIADGHHRYETAMAFRNENPRMHGADRVMMTFVNMYSPGLKILATHRLVANLPDFDAEEFLRRAAVDFQVETADSVEKLKKCWESADKTTIGVAIGDRLYALTARDLVGALDVKVLHEVLLAKTLGVSEEAVREERNLRYIRGLDAAMEEARKGTAQVAFLLKPTSIQQVADISFGGGVMPQKSTDFYPKLLSGLTIYKF
jgi:uncharacterized protein (DUF1015 family)